MNRPGLTFVDHHVHFMSTAAAGLSLDVSGERSIDDLAAATARAAAGRIGWVRAWGYDEHALDEGRHPTRAELDSAGRAAGTAGVPIVVHHRTGHAAVLNSAAMSEIGEDHPDGLLVDRHDLLARVPRLGPEELRAAAGRVSARWAAQGISGFVDATATNGPEELETLARWCGDGTITQRVVAMVSPAAIAEIGRFASRVGAVRVGHAKVMPGPDLEGQIRAAHQAGFPVAVHVTEIDVLERTLAALESSRPPPGTVDRIEHNALSLPEQIGRIAAVGATVVVNPSFLLHRRAKYERALQPVERSWLIRMRSLVDAGVTVRAGSDSPVTPACPEEMVAAAMTHPFSPEESLDAEAAVRLFSRPNDPVWMEDATVTDPIW